MVIFVNTYKDTERAGDRAPLKITRRGYLVIVSFFAALYVFVCYAESVGMP
jgi:hypothetical protein